MRKEKTKKKLLNWMMSEEYSKLKEDSTSRNMKPLEVWTCQRAENLKKKSSNIPKITTQQKWYRRRADQLSAAAAARRSTKVGGGGAHQLSAAAARRGRRTALLRLFARGSVLRSIARWKVKALCHLRPYPRGPLRPPKQVERAATVWGGENCIRRAWSTSTATGEAPASARTCRRWRG